MTSRPASVLLMAGVVVASASAGAQPLRDAIAGALAPGDFATDFVPAARRWRGDATAVDVRAGNAEAAPWGVPPYADIGVPFGAHPPPAVLLVAALVPLGFRAAAVAWLALSLACAAVLAWILTGVLATAPGAPGRGRVLLAGAMLLALVLWPPVLHNLEKGQWSLVIAALLAAGWRASSRGEGKSAGAFIAGAGLLKVMPFIALVAIAACSGRRWRAVAAGAAITVGVAVAASLAVFGPGTWGEFMASAPTNTEGWQTGPANTLSLWGALARLLVGGPFARPALSGPGPLWAARVLWATIAAGLLAVTLYATLTGQRSPPERRTTNPIRPNTAFAAWSVLAVVLGPLSWSHTAVWLLLPAALLASPLPPATGVPPPGFVEGRPLPRLGPAALATAVVILSVPRATLFSLAGPWPTAPGRGLLLSLHLVAALVLLFVAVHRLFELRRTPRTL